MVSRRELLTSGLATSASLLLARRSSAGTFRPIPQRVSARVIVDNDLAGDPDGLVALAHQLLSPKTRTTLVTVSALDPKLAGRIPPGASAASGREIALELIRQSGLAAVPVVAGRERLGIADAPPSAAARAIVAEAMRDDPLPLFFTCGGPLTNLADALRLEPRIAARMTVIWIGGGPYPRGGWEYNLAADVTAARWVIERSRVRLWQVPQDAYRQMQFSVAEYADRLRTISPFGAWLYDRFTAPPDFVDIPGSWPLGDTPTVLLSAISAESSSYVDRPARSIGAHWQYGAPIGGRTIRVFERLDARLAIEDFLALMRLHAAKPA